MSALAKLIAAHPLLFRGAPPAVPSHLPEGWYGLVHQLCLDIECSLGMDGCIVLRVEQLRERRGRLRFYYSLAGSQDLTLDIHSREGDRTIVREAEGPPAMSALRALVERAVEASTHTCQVCGAPGAHVACGVWAATLCVAHASDLGHQRTEDSL